MTERKQGNHSPSTDNSLHELAPGSGQASFEEQRGKGDELQQNDWCGWWGKAQPI